MNKLMAITRLCLMVSCGLRCTAGQMWNDGRCFEDLLSVWFDRLSWSVGEGFSVTINRENPPGHIQLDGNSYEDLTTDKGVLRLERGKCYFITGGRAGGQRLKYVDPNVEPTNSVAYSVFGREESLLYFEQINVCELEPEASLKRRAYVVSANGAVYDVERREKRNFALPFVAPRRMPIEDREKQSIRRVAQNNLCLVRKAYGEVATWALRNSEMMSIGNGVTNEVCYNEFGNPNAESYRLVLKNPNLKPEFRALVESRLIEDHSDRDDWALVVRQDNGVKIVAVNEGLWSGLLRYSWFSESGKVEAIMQSNTFDEQSFYSYDGEGNLQEYIAIVKGKAKSFWVRENGDYVECKDEARAKKLIDDAMARSRQFKRGAK